MIFQSNQVAIVPFETEGTEIEIEVDTGAVVTIMSHELHKTEFTMWK